MIATHISTSDRVRAVIATTIGKSVDRIQDTSTLLYLGADSLDEFATIMALEEEVSVEIADDEAFECRTVADITSMIQRKVST